MSRKKNILVIEDEEDLLEILEGSLKTAGYDVISGKNGSEGLFKYKNQKFDLVITDIKMPKLDGIEVVKNIRRDEKSKDLPIIVASGNVTEFKPELSLFENIHMLEKPYKKKDILEVCQKAFSVSSNTDSESVEFNDIFIESLRLKANEMLSIITREKNEPSDISSDEGQKVINYDFLSTQLIIGNEFLGNMYFCFEKNLANEITNGLSQSEKGTQKSNEEILQFLSLFTKALFVKTGELLKLKKIKIRRTPFSITGNLSSSSSLLIDKGSSYKTFNVKTSLGEFHAYLIS